MRAMLDRQFRAIVGNAPDGVLVEAGDSIAYVNAAYAHILGYETAAELAEATIEDIADPADVERLRWFGRCRSEGKPAPTRYTFNARRRQGEVITLDASISAVRSDGELLITTIVRELHVEKRAALELPGTKKLSSREREVVQHLLAGRRSKEIALILDISEKTVDTHRSRAFQKLALRGIADLFRVATESASP